MATLAVALQTWYTTGLREGPKTISRDPSRPRTPNKTMKEEKELFPHNGFPIRLEYQDRNDYRICWFQCQNHLDKHIKQHKLKQSELKIQYQDPLLSTPLPVVEKEDDEPKKRGRKPKQQLFSPLDQFFEPIEKFVAPVGTGTRGKGTQKRSRS